MHSLKILKLIGFGEEVITQDFITIFSNKNLKNLLELELISCKGVNDEVIETIALGCPRLESIELYNLDNVNDQSIQFLIKHCTNLQKIRLGLYQLTEDCLSEINTHLLKLRVLDLKCGPRIERSYLEQIVKNSSMDLKITYQ